MKAVTLKEIERIFAITDGLGISREALVIPLRPAHPAQVRKIGSGKFEIVVDSEADFEHWLSCLAQRLRALLETQAD